MASTLPYEQCSARPRPLCGAAVCSGQQTDQDAAQPGADGYEHPGASMLQHLGLTSYQAPAQGGEATASDGLDHLERIQYSKHTETQVSSTKNVQRKGDGEPAKIGPQSGRTSGVTCKPARGTKRVGCQSADNARRSGRQRSNLQAWREPPAALVTQITYRLSSLLVCLWPPVFHLTLHALCGAQPLVQPLLGVSLSQQAVRPETWPDWGDAAGPRWCEPWGDGC